MEDGNAYTIAINVEKPKAQKSEKKLSKGSSSVTKTIKQLFGTDIVGGKLKIQKEKKSGQATVTENNTLIINPADKDSIKLRYDYLNKSYKMTIKIN